MSKRGRKPKLDRPVTWKANIPSSLAQRVEALLPRNAKGDIPLSSKADLTTELLRNWCDARNDAPSPTLDDLLPDDNSPTSERVSIENETANMARFLLDLPPDKRHEALKDWLDSFPPPKRETARSFLEILMR